MIINAQSNPSNVWCAPGMLIYPFNLLQRVDNIFLSRDPLIFDECLTKPFSVSGNAGLSEWKYITLSKLLS